MSRNRNGPAAQIDRAGGSRRRCGARCSWFVCAVAHVRALNLAPGRALMWRRTERMSVRPGATGASIARRTLEPMRERGMRIAQRPAPAKTGRRGQGEAGLGSGAKAGDCTTTDADRIAASARTSRSTSGAKQVHVKRVGIAQAERAPAGKRAPPCRAGGGPITESTAIAIGRSRAAVGVRARLEASAMAKSGER